MADIDVAVVIVTYRSAQLTIDAVRSLESERGAVGLRLRAIVVDNDSGDLPVIALAMEHNGWSSWLTLIKAPKNGGFAYGNNLGVSRAFADGPPHYIYLLNPDAQVRPGAIAALIHFLAGHPDVGIAGSSFENLDGSDWPIAFRFPSLIAELDAGLQWGFVSRLLKKWVVARVMSKESQPIDWICGASMMIRAGVFTSIGGLDENYFLYFEETDFCLRAKLAGFSTWYVPESRVMHIMGQSTTLTDPRLGLRRLPSYWFESRRRYYVVAFGITRAVLIDIAAMAAHSIGLMKRVVQGKRHKSVPHFIRDLVRHSIIWPHNRRIAPLRIGAQHSAQANHQLLSNETHNGS